jgi:hypothetical protein
MNMGVFQMTAIYSKPASVIYENPASLCNGADKTKDAKKLKKGVDLSFKIIHCRPFSVTDKNGKCSRTSSIYSRSTDADSIYKELQFSANSSEVSDGRRCL